MINQGEKKSIFILKKDPEHVLALYFILLQNSIVVIVILCSPIKVLGTTCVDAWIHAGIHPSQPGDHLKNNFNVGAKTVQAKA